MNDPRERRNPRPWFATPSGSRYHDSPYCNGITTQNAKQLSTAQVRARKLTPCTVCRPTPVLRIVR